MTLPTRGRAPIGPTAPMGPAGAAGAGCTDGAGRTAGARGSGLLPRRAERRGTCGRAGRGKGCGFGHVGELGNRRSLGEQDPRARSRSPTMPFSTQYRTRIVIRLQPKNSTPMSGMALATSRAIAERDMAVRR